MIKLWSLLHDRLSYPFHRRPKASIAGLANWSIPQRDNVNIPPIPLDIYLVIFDHIQLVEDGESESYKHLLRNLSLVCRFFNSVFVPRLFESFRIILDLAKADDHGIMFYNALINDKEPVCSLARHIRVCFFGSLGRPSALPSPYPPQAIMRLVNLRSLTLSRVLISTTLLEALGSLERLETLSITYSGLSPSVIVPKGRCLQLKNFTFFNTLTPPQFAEDLARLVTCPTLRTLHTTCVAFLRAFMSQPTAFNLEALTYPLSGELIPDLVEFLNRTPSITTLSFPVYSWEEPSSFQGLLPTALPHLKALHCPSCLAAYFVPGRPVKRIDLDAPAISTQGGVTLAEVGSGDGSRLFDILQQSTAAIEMLHVPVDTYFVASFGDHFPQLRTLCLEYPLQRKQSEFTQNIDALCQRWAATPPLTELRIKSRHCWSSAWMFNLEMQHHLIVSSVVVAFPTVAQVVFTESVEWKKDHQQQWQPVIPRFARLMLKSRLQLSSFPFVKDYNGCLASLFNPDELNNGMRQILGLPLRPSWCRTF